MRERARPRKAKQAGKSRHWAKDAADLNLSVSSAANTNDRRIVLTLGRIHHSVACTAQPGPLSSPIFPGPARMPR